MQELVIERLGSPVLHQRAQEVEEITDDLRELVRRMFATMYAADGQGLAGPQVGISRRIAVVDVPPRGGHALVLVNPRVVASGAKRIRAVEGCLSLPGVWGRADRPAEVVVEARDLSGAALRLQADGDLARCLQHEIDHLEGVLYIHHMSPLARSMLLARYRRLESRRPVR
jgi:peptide deformylase